MHLKRRNGACQRYDNHVLQTARLHADRRRAVQLRQFIQVRLHLRRKRVLAQRGARQGNQSRGNAVFLRRLVHRHQMFAGQHPQDVQACAGHKVERAGDFMYAQRRVAAPQQAQDRDAARQRRHLPDPRCPGRRPSRSPRRHNRTHGLLHTTIRCIVHIQYRVLFDNNTHPGSPSRRNRSGESHIQ